MNDNQNPDGSVIDLEKGKNAHVSTTVYMHSEQLMMLVKELHDHWRDDPILNKHNDHARTLWFYSGLLASDAAAFIEIFNLSFNTRLVFDSQKEPELCWEMLNILRKARGVHIFGRA